jgi:Mg-chelatase subunit ChlD
MTRLLRVTAVLVLTVAFVSLVPGHDADARVLQQNPVCTVTVDKAASPAQITLGETVTVTLKVEGTCPEREHPADVILAIDHSESMASNNKLVAAKNAAITFVNRMDPALVRVGIVAVAPTAAVVQSLTTDQAALVTAIQNLTTERGTNIVDGLDVSRAELTGAGARAGVRKVIIFLTDGKHSLSSPPESALAGVIDAVRAAGIEVFAIGLGTDADEAVLRQMATDAAHYFYSPTTAELDGIYVQIAGRTQAAVLFNTSVVTDVLPANMTYLPASAAPVAPVHDAATRTLRWSLDSVVGPGYTLTYQVRPTEVGYWPTNTSAQLDYVDGFGNAGALPFPVPHVRVIASSPSGASCVCTKILQRVPPAVVADALANPTHYDGYMQRLDPKKPASPANPPRDCLTLMNVNLAYHPLANGPRWRVGCP